MIGLRVLHLLPDCDGGPLATSTLDLMRWLARDGHATALLTAGGCDETAVTDEGFTVLRYRTSRPRWWLRGKKELVAALAIWNADLIHVHAIAALPLALSLAKALGVKVVAACETLVDQADGLTDPRVAWVLAPTESHRAHLVSRLGLPRDRVALLPEGIDLDRLAAPPAPTGDPLPVLAMVAGEAALDRLLAVLNDLRTGGLQLDVVVANRPAEAVTAAAAARGLAGAVRPAAAKARFDVLAAAAAIVVLVGADEAADVAAARAMAAGRPVIAPATAELAEVVHDGATGTLVGDDHQALAGALRAIADGALRQRWATAARTLASERYAMTLIGRAALELYRTALSGCRTESDRAEGSTVYRRITEPKVRP